ncbi:helix-turn-helix domain-containing protein [Candidatus Rariloculus sp.]|uniref:helix-turn-helix domain-containing protein n=1 Tax=Candidatus Rariloculus sp. TaxID=3101265 RepID=UPI003D14139C
MCAPGSSGAAEEKEVDMEFVSMFLSPREAGDWLGLSPRTLERYRGTGEGPVFYRFGRHVRYRKADLNAWAKTRRRMSTRDRGNACRAAARWHGRRSPRRATGDRQGPVGALRGGHRTSGSRDVQRAGVRRARRAARAGGTDRVNGILKRD